MARTGERVAASFWIDRAIGPAQFLRGRFAGYAYDPHTHEHACFAMILGGAIRIRSRGQAFTARAGDLYAIEAEEPHAGQPVDDDGWSLRTLYADLNHYRERWAEGRNLGGTLAGPIVRDPGLAEAFVRLHRASEEGAGLLAREHHLLVFLDRLFERHVLAPQEPPCARRESGAVRKARAFLDEHLDERVGLAEVAAATGLPEFRLYRAFVSEVGVSPHVYQRQVRVRRAGEWIRRGLPLGDIAVAAGFADQAHLTRVFRRSLGITPGAYRRAVLGDRAAAP
jgi:AraC-like DNA-binding protein